MIAWEKITRFECDLTVKIINRFFNRCPEGNYAVTLMDLEACHIENPLDLSGLLNANDGDFFHDVCGIIRHIDRETGKLKNCFSPRYSRDKNDYIE